MQITHLKLENWRNFRSVDVDLKRRVFIVGPNASGKSNLLDVLRFLRDIAEPEGGFQRAVNARGGVSQLRCLHARRPASIAIQTEIQLENTRWTYQLEFGQDNQRKAIVKKEAVKCNDREVLVRPDAHDQSDPNRLFQTHLEQLNANKEFRDVAEFLSDIRYLHIVPQLIRESDRIVVKSNDPHGSDFLDRLASTPSKTRNARLRSINQALKVAVPQLREMDLKRDLRGVPHLEGLYEHWRPNAGRQTEAHFSDGTLRLLGLLWSFLDGDAPLLLEEPELSLHKAIVRQIPSMMARANRRGKRHRQTLISTHSPDLLTDESIAPEEVLLLVPSGNGTLVETAAQDMDIRKLLDVGIPIAQSVFEKTSPKRPEQLSLFGS